MWNPLKKKNKNYVEIATEVRYRYILEIDLKQGRRHTSWEEYSEEVPIGKTWIGFLDWYRYKPLKHSYEIDTDDMLISVQRDNIAGFSITKRKVSK